MRVLTDDVINKIAAGEVIERPAAVVKELLENALDAEASRVEVEFRHGGKSYIRVEDDGYGMSPDQALLALERHATSKLQSADDLLSIVSMGFRGEALPSIASVSRFTLRTRPADREGGSELLINGGKMVHRRDCGMAPGTRIEVANLFGPVPARRKFLKTDNTEAAHIVHLVRLYAIARPEVDFSLVEDGRLIFRSPRGPDLQHRVAEIWGQQIAGPLVVLPESKGQGIRVSGLIGRPGTGRSTRREMITLVNRRPVDSRTLNYALIEGYHTYIPKGRYPLAFLFLEIEPAAVDVNVHPAKREIRFRDEGKVRRFVLEAVNKRLNELASGELAFESEPQPDAAAEAAAAIMAQKQPPSPSPVSDYQASRKGASPKPSPAITPAYKAVASLNRKPLPEAESAELPSVPARSSATEKRRHDASPDWRLVGILNNGRALFETRSGLVIVQLKPAHERIWFERLQKQFAEGVVSQKLLLPISIELDSLSAAALKNNIGFLSQHGFDLEEFGRNFFRIEGHPSWLQEHKAEVFVLDVIHALREGEIDPKKLQLGREVLARMSATRAIRFSDHPSDAEVMELIRQLLACDHPLICPNGKPTYFEMPHREIASRLGQG